LGCYETVLKKTVLPSNRMKAMLDLVSRNPLASPGLRQPWHASF
jgi:hypothetical protein